MARGRRHVSNAIHIPQLTEKELTRFWTKIAKNVNSMGCWVWSKPTGGTGYGVFPVTREGKKIGIPARRLTFHLVRGKFDTTKTLYSTCGAPTCVNPDHMEVHSPALD